MYMRSNFIAILTAAVLVLGLGHVTRAETEPVPSSPQQMTATSPVLLTFSRGPRPGLLILCAQGFYCGEDIVIQRDGSYQYSGGTKFKVDGKLRRNELVELKQLINQTDYAAIPAGGNLVQRCSDGNSSNGFAVTAYSFVSQSGQTTAISDCNSPLNLEEPLLGPANAIVEKIRAEVNSSINASTTNLLRVATTGGFCRPSLCDTELVIERDGRYQYVVGEVVRATGQLQRSELVELKQLVQQADYKAIKSQPFQGVCPILFDGIKTIYTFFVKAQPREIIDDCVVAVDAENPLFRQTDVILQRISREVRP